MAVVEVVGLLPRVIQVLQGLVHKDIMEEVLTFIVVLKKQAEEAVVLVVQG
jgi:hypothetical protein